MNYDWDTQYKSRGADFGTWSGREMLERVRQSLQARLEGRNEGGDVEVMRLVDEIVEKEILKRIGTGDGHNGWYKEG